MATAQRTYLRCASPRRAAPGASRRSHHPGRARGAVLSPALWRFLYAEVGRKYHWVDRLSWTDDDIRAHLAADDAVSIWLMMVQGTPAGYFELQRGRRRRRSRSPTSVSSTSSPAAGLARICSPSRWKRPGASTPSPRVAAHLLARSSGRAAELHEARLHARSRPKSILCDVTEPLWAPSRRPRRRAEPDALHARCRRAIRTRRSPTTLRSTDSRSIARPTSGGPMWDFTGVIGERGERVVDHLDRMPGRALLP